jgi:hypothetical protein
VAPRQRTYAGSFEPEGDFYVEIADTDDVYYTSGFAFGSNLQNISLVYDTQTDWTLVQSKLCTMCNQTASKYDRMASNVSIPGNIGVTQLNFSRSLLIGDTRIDQVCVYIGTHNKTCVYTGFTFFEITSISGPKLGEYSGILGLAPDDPNNGPSYISAMKNSDLISRRMLGMQINRDNLQSIVTYGGVTASMMWKDNSTQAPVFYYPTTDPKRWII